MIMRKVFVAILVIAVVALGYFLLSKKNIISPPSKIGEEKTVTQTLSLILSSPQDKLTVTEAKILVKGTTSPNAEVFVNDTSVKADSSGNFSISLTLDEGENTISVSANDAEGNFVEKELTVTFTP